MKRCCYNAKSTKYTPYITELVVYEILTWVPAQDLVRYKTVCKKWKSLIDDRAFIQLHKSRAALSILATAKHPSCSRLSAHGLDVFILNEQKGRLVGPPSCGFACIEEPKDTYQVCNPATGKSFPLPPLKSNSFAREMRAYPNLGRREFTVVALCEYSPTTSSQTFYWASFTLGVDFEWRCLEYPLGTNACGPLSWWTSVLCESGPIGLAKITEFEPMQTFRLDPSTGEHIIFRVPFHLEEENIKSLRAHKWDDKFAISTVGEEEICTWVLDDEDNNKWNFVKVVANCIDDIFIDFVQQGKMWFRAKSLIGDLLTLDLLTNKVESVSCSCSGSGSGMQIYYLEPYCSTLEIIEGMI